MHGSSARFAVGERIAARAGEHLCPTLPVEDARDWTIDSDRIDKVGRQEPRCLGLSHVHNVDVRPSATLR